ncbi:MAG: mechanosensitive ion channel, partial [Coriobacteriaceae bacterium]|nr:mechanosensitive ion channel [Coriobacteriaceae bacterium]
EVMDVSWRQTVLRDKDNNTHVLPNAALMSEAFMRRENKMIDRYTIDCDIKPGLDLQRVAEDIEQLADQVLEEKGWRTERRSEVRYVGSTANGVKASVRIFIKDISLTTNAMDAVMRAIGQRGYLADWTNDNPLQDAWR